MSLLQTRSAVEALRSGVPSGAVVHALGSGQAALEERFTSLLHASESFDGQVPGLLVRAGFGEGKSHLLTCFEHLALDRGFAVSRVVISKETPLQVPLKLLQSAVESLRVPQTVGRGLDEVGVLLKRRFQTVEFQDLVVRLEEGPLAAHFPATLQIFQRGAHEDDELADRILRFWSGQNMKVSDLKRTARELGIREFQFEPLRDRERALQTATFLPLLTRAAGLRGWVLLIDELELIGRYSRLARANSYVELARWLGALADVRPGLVTVGAITADFAREVLEEKGDLDAVGPYLRARDPEHAAHAEKGMQLIRDARLLDPPDDALLRHTYQTLKHLHEQAYRWTAPDVAWPEVLAATPMRTFVRGWINAWDVRRLYPDSRADEDGYDYDRVTSSYREEPGLESAPDE